MPKPVIVAALASDPLMARPLPEEMSTTAPLPELRAMAEPGPQPQTENLPVPQTLLRQGKIVAVHAEPPSHEPEPKPLEDPGPQISVAATVPLPSVEAASLGLSGGTVSASITGNLFWPKREPPATSESPAVAGPGPQPHILDAPMPQPLPGGGITGVLVKPPSEPAHKPEPGHELEHPSRSAPGPQPPNHGEPVPGLPLAAAAKHGLSGAALKAKQAKQRRTAKKLLAKQTKEAKKLLARQAAIAGVSMKRPAGDPPATPAAASEAAPGAMETLSLPPPPPLAHARGNGETFQGRRRPKDPAKAAEFDEQRRLYWENKQQHKIEQRELKKKDTDLLLLHVMLGGDSAGIWSKLACAVSGVVCVGALSPSTADNCGLPGRQWLQKEEG